VCLAVACPYSGAVDLERVAEQFDAVYSEMTVLQRRLIAAVRAGEEDRAVRDLAERADVITHAIWIAERTLGVGRSADQIEAEALATRVLQAPVDDHLLLAAMGAQGRRHAYMLLAAGLRMSADEMPDGLAGRSLVALLAAPRSLGESTARQLLTRWGWDTAVVVGDLDHAQLERMCAEIDEAAIGLPDGIRRNTQRPAASADGCGASGRVLEVWVDQTGAPSDGIGSLAFAAAQAPGWPDDAVPTALMIARLALDRIVEHLAPHWLAIAEIADADEQIRAIRAQSAQWFRETGDEQFADYVLYRTVEILLARKHLRAMDGEWGTRRGGNTAIGHSRKIAKCCGELLSTLEPASAETVLAGVPQSLARHTS
jgi:hypothetical protein